MTNTPPPERIAAAREKVRQAVWAGRRGQQPLVFGPNLDRLIAFERAEAVAAQPYVTHRDVNSGGAMCRHCLNNDFLKSAIRAIEEAP